MFDFYEKRKIRHLIYSKPVIAVLFIVAVFIAYSAYGRYTVEREMNQKRLDKEAQLKSLQERATALETQVDGLQNKRGVEGELRSRFDVAKKDEQVVILVNNDNERNATSLEALSIPPGGSQKNDSKSPFSFLNALKFW